MLLWTRHVPARTLRQPSGFSKRTIIKEAAECVKQILQVFWGKPSRRDTSEPLIKSETHLGHSKLSHASSGAKLTPPLQSYPRKLYFAFINIKSTFIKSLQPCWEVWIPMQLGLRWLWSLSFLPSLTDGFQRDTWRRGWAVKACTCACISAYVLMVMGQSVETQVNNQWRKQAFTDFLEKFWHFPRWEESCSCTAERLIFISSPVLLSRPNLSRIEGGVNQAPMAATSTTNSTQLCPKSKMTAQPCSQIWRQSFPWIEFSAAFRLKKNKKSFTTAKVSQSGTTCPLDLLYVQTGDLCCNTTPRE